ncbi:carbohydrate ABC transporter permease [Ruania alba]|uniref:carbohydrate ABC transporter permease n=1 Tax=Ruania alba TaxID=648782 RepID=UPI001C31583C|nr:carbohydrate ABC transporter permease [Ruania alba]
MHESPGTDPAPRLRKSYKHRILAIWPYVLMVPVALTWVYPFVWMVTSSFKSNSEMFGSTSLIPESFHWENWQRAWYQVDIGRYFGNTVFVTVATIFIVVATSSMIGYVLGRYTFPGKKIVIAAFIATVLVPEGYTIIPLFDLINNLGLGGSLWGVVLAESGGAHVMIILLFAGYFRQIPNEIEEAAQIDGAGFVRQFFTIMLPLTKPVVATAVILTLMRSWNSFLIPLVLTLSNPDARTLAVGVYSFQGENMTDWTGMTAASTISLLPIVIVFLFLQRYFIEGMTGAVRG